MWRGFFVFTGGTEAALIDGNPMALNLPSLAETIRVNENRRKYMQLTGTDAAESDINWLAAEQEIQAGMPSGDAGASAQPSDPSGTFANQVKGRKKKKKY